MTFTALVHLRLARGLKQQEVLRRMGGAAPGYLSNFENGLVAGSDDYLARYAAALGVHVRQVRRARDRTLKRRAA